MNSTPLIVFESDDFLVLDKPPGWLSVPAREPKESDRVVGQWVWDEKKVKPYIIHRLDRFTSGVLILAKNDTAHRLGNLWFEKRIAKKIYHFLASPAPSLPAVQIRTPVDGKAAQTLFEVIEKTDSHFYGRAIPMTGRFHQIREHAAEAGFPILGDKAYRGAPAVRGCLHAYSLETPIGRFTAPFAPDLAEIWRKLSHDS